MDQRSTIESRYASAKQQYADFGVDTERALTALGNVHLSVHCWQGDDVTGFEVKDTGLSTGGIQVTGVCPGPSMNSGGISRRPSHSSRDTTA